MMKRLIGILFALFAVAVQPAAASDCWGNATGAQTNCGVVLMYLNPSGQSVPATAAAPLPITGGGTSAAPSIVDTVASGGNLIDAVKAAIPAGTNTIGTVGQLPYPVGATPITASATGTTGATTATLAGTSGKTTYICGYSIRANATAAATVTNTITGVITATLSSIMWVAPLASGIGIDEQIFAPCIPASATNTAIAVVSGAPGSGGTVSSKGWGYQL